MPYCYIFVVILKTMHLNGNSQDKLSQTLQIKKRINSIALLMTKLQRAEGDPSFFSQFNTHINSVNIKDGALILFLNYRPGKKHQIIQHWQLLYLTLFIKKSVTTENGNFFYDFENKN